MHQPLTHHARVTRGLPGAFLGVVSAIVVVLLTGPVSADSKLGNGMQCKGTNDCRSGSCIQGICKGKGSEKKDNGAACKGTYECKSSSCIQGFCRGKGSEKKDNGAACKGTNECKSNSCIQGVCKGH